MTARIAPSLLSSDFARLADEIARVETAGADLLHVDVMDGHFVPNITIGPAVVAAVKRVTKLPLDLHLMIAEPDRYLDAFIGAGAAMVAVHAEVLPHLHRTLVRIRQLGAKAGVALNPSTPITAIRDVMDELDYVIVMSVNPGFGGQTFIPHSLEKIGAMRRMLDAAGSKAAIEGDGGIKLDNVRSVVSAGASILAVGAAIFEAPDAVAAIRALREATAVAAR